MSACGVSNPTRCSRSTRRISPLRCGSPVNTGSKWIPMAMRRQSSCAKARVRCTAKTLRMSSIRGNHIASPGRTCVSTSMSTRRASTSSIAGRAIAIAATTPLSRRVMCRRTWSVIRISIRTAPGVSTQPTATSGSRIGWPSAGRLTATAIGHGSIRGVGPGSMTRPGASRYPTTAAGRISAEHGVGYPVPSALAPTMPRHWSCSSVAATSSFRSPVATSEESGGSRLGRARSISRPIR